MTKALLKKQLAESFSWLFFNRKNGKKRDAKGIVLYAVLYLLIFAVLAVMIYYMANSLCAPLCELGLGWLYFAIIGLLGIVLGVFGSVFSTYSMLYQAKDNDLLLSMPIPSSAILFARLSGVYIIGLMYELIVMIPALIVWFISYPVGITAIITSILIPFILSFFVLTLSCILGWAVALIGSRVKHKSAVTVVLSLGFIAGYYYVYFNAYNLLINILANAQSIAKSVKSILYPLYHMGLAAEGKILSMAVFTIIVAVLFAAVYFVLQKSFIKLATANKGGAKVKYKEKKTKAKSADSALLRKELKRFSSSANYMMNCGLGIIIMPIGAVAVLIKSADIAELMGAIFAQNKDIIYLLITACVCLITSMNAISAPSVSLEGNHIWLAHVLPIEPWQVLKAKLKLHLILNLPAVIIFTAALLIVFKPGVPFAVLVSVCVLLFTSLMALFGLFLNLLAPNLNWTNEVVPIKQSMSVTLSLFGGWGIVIFFGIAYFVLSKWISPMLFLLLAAVLLIISNAALFIWLKNKGSKKFAEL